MKRMIAFFILFIPGSLAAYGIKLLRDAVFGILQPPFSIVWVQSIIGLLLTAGGIAFIAGFILHRDRKRKKVQSRFEKF